MMPVTLTVADSDSEKLFAKFAAGADFKDSADIDYSDRATAENSRWVAHHEDTEEAAGNRSS